MKIKSYLSLIAITILLACNSADKKAQETGQATTTEQEGSSNEVLTFENQSYQKVFTAYIKLKDQLVASNPETSKATAEELFQVLKGDASFEKLIATVQKIIDAKDIATQRTDFTTLNNEIIPVFKQAKLNSGIIYVQHCPMANNGDGGDWLAMENKIQNPYYGDEMMECGAVIEKIKKN